jgi:hypothetical protein
MGLFHLELGLVVYHDLADFLGCETTIAALLVGHEPRHIDVRTIIRYAE